MTITSSVRLAEIKLAACTSEAQRTLSSHSTGRILGCVYTTCSKKRRCLWCNGYRLRKWTRRHEFKSWTWLIAFLIALILFGKVWIPLFSLQLWEIVGQTGFFSLGKTTSLGEGKLWIQTVKFRLKIDLVWYPTRAEGLVNMIYHFFIWSNLNFSSQS